MNKVDVSIIIVSYNTKELLVDCIKSVVKTTQAFSFEVIVVDNNSSDGSAEEVEQEFKKDDRILVIKNPDNSGFSAANNIGVKKSHGRYVLFLNPDTVVHEKTIDGMIMFMDETPDCGASTCFLRMPNGELDDAAHRGFPTPWRSFAYFSGLAKTFPKSKLFAGYNLTYLDLKQTHEIEALAGAFMLVRREAGEEVKWWDEDYFFYGEDLDFCFNLKKKGWKIYFVPTYEILHYKGAAGGMKKTSQNVTKASPETKKRAVDARFNAMKIFYNKNYRKKYPAFVTWLVMSGINTKAFLTKHKI